MQFISMTKEERERLEAALRSNAGHDGAALLMNPSDTSFEGVSDELDDQSVVDAIKSVPTHY